MKIDIETYKGQLIQYDDDRDRFASQMATGDAYDMKERKSLVEVRKAIDLFLKANLEFKPFKVMNENGRVNELVAIRTDGKFINASRSQFTSSQLLTIKDGYSDNYGYYFDPEIKEKLDEIEAERERLQKELRVKKDEVLKALKPLPSDYLAQYSL